MGAAYLDGRQIGDAGRSAGPWAQAAKTIRDLIGPGAANGAALRVVGGTEARAGE